VVSQDAPGVAVVVPNWNGAHLLERCIESIEHQSHRVSEIVVVDNGSTDGSLRLLQQRFPGVRTIALPENRGFAEAVNIGVAACSADYVLILNNDAQLAPGAVEAMYKALEGAKFDRVWAVAPLILQTGESSVDEGGAIPLHTPPLGVGSDGSGRTPCPDSSGGQDESAIGGFEDSDQSKESKEHYGGTFRIDSLGQDYSIWGLAYPRLRGEDIAVSCDPGGAGSFRVQLPPRIAAAAVGRAEALCISGAACLVRRELFLSCGGFDEYYFAYYEDVDLSLRMAHRGYRVLVDPKAVVFHHLGATSGGNRSLLARERMVANSLETWLADVPSPWVWLFLPLVLLSQLLWFFQGLMLGLAPAHLRGWARVAHRREAIAAKRERNIGSTTPEARKVVEEFRVAFPPVLKFSRRLLRVPRRL
jgi:GT2 family glycosyltransferase